MNESPVIRSTILLTLRYHNADHAIEWLCSAFGFEEHLVVKGEEAGQIRHAQLKYGDGMIMLGSVRDDELGQFQKTPSELDGAASHCAYVVVSDVDDHYKRAVNAGATIVTDLKQEEYGARGYSCRDPEGHLWYFGDYDPWQDQSG